MAIIEICDGCGKQSPTKEKHFIGNNWHKISHYDRRRKKRRSADDFWLLCEDCFILFMDVMESLTKHE